MSEKTKIEEYKIGPYGYQIKRNGRRFELWLGGCRIGRPRPDKPGEIWEYSAPTLKEAQRELEIDAAEHIEGRIDDLEHSLNEMRATLATLNKTGLTEFRAEQSS